ncbi:MAG TPA: ATP-binding protein [Kofleriaceae bacterium]
MDRLAVEVLDEQAASLQLATVAQAVFVIDTNGVVDDVNAVAEDLVGYPRDELIGQRLRFLTNDIPLPTAHVRSFAACMRHRSGHEVLVDVLLCPDSTNANIVFMTPRSSQELARRNSEVVQIVHDLKNPLATIALEMCLLEDKLMQSELRNVVNRVSQNVAFLDRMVHDLLDASSMEADCFHVHRSRTSLRELIEEVIERSIATRDRARVSFQSAAELTLPLDALRIERVVANLLHNALKYSPATTQVVLRLEKRQMAARVSVTDAGPGISDYEATQIFDKYTRASSAKSLEGNGLGLYVSKRIVEAHGGTIGVHSVKGVGSVFYFDLPLDP